MGFISRVFRSKSYSTPNLHDNGNKNRFIRVPSSTQFLSETVKSQSDLLPEQQIIERLHQKQIAVRQENEKLKGVNRFLQAKCDLLLDLVTELTIENKQQASLLKSFDVYGHSVAIQL